MSGFSFLDIIGVNDGKAGDVFKVFVIASNESKLVSDSLFVINKLLDILEVILIQLLAMLFLSRTRDIAFDILVSFGLIGPIKSISK